MTQTSFQDRLLTPLTRACLVTLTALLPICVIAIPLFLFQSNLPQIFYEFYEISVCLAYIAYTWFFTRIIDRRPWSVLELKLDKNALKGFLAALLLTIVIVLLGSWLSIIFFHDRFSGTVHFGLPELWRSFALSFLLQGFPEEMVWRGYLVQTLQKKPMPTLFISSALFALDHIVHIIPFFGGNPYDSEGYLTIFYAFCLGILSCLMKYLFRTTWAAVAVHSGMHMTLQVLTAVIPGFYETKTMMLLTPCLMLVVSAFIIYYQRQRLVSWEKLQPQTTIA
ncbi:CPBP family intramembrane glutamic endopeptidase [Streptococcus sp. H31]|uniref:CPBP family intramembrane glutamic endopeptidase n=1 Tax=Streptococcus huangxiaojuni TaxID=3237239 RepID=UPI0034A4F74B